MAEQVVIQRKCAWHSRGSGQLTSIADVSKKHAATASQPENQMDGGAILDAVAVQRVPIFQDHTRADQALLVYRYAFLTGDPSFHSCHILMNVHFEGDGLPGESLQQALRG